MRSTKLIYSRSQIKLAGKRLRQAATDPESVGRATSIEAEEVLRAWRWAHAQPMDVAQAALRSHLAAVAGVEGGSVTQRLKERPSIVAKLVRAGPAMQLTTMQDIAGVRAVVTSRSRIFALLDRMQSVDAMKVRRIDDSMAVPRPSGYRAVHVIMEHVDELTGGARLVEVQLRTTEQHQWANGVEALARRSGYAPKHREGPAELLEYLRILAERLEEHEAGFDVPKDVLSDLRSMFMSIPPTGEGDHDD
jgi:putative GTP pyrophosphokinase